MLVWAAFGTGQDEQADLDEGVPGVGEGCVWGLQHLRLRMLMQYLCGGLCDAAWMLVAPSVCPQVGRQVHLASYWVPDPE